MHEEPTAAEIVQAGVARGQLDKECVPIDQRELDEAEEQLIQQFVRDGCKCDYGPVTKFMVPRDKWSPGPFVPAIFGPPWSLTVPPPPPPPPAHAYQEPAFFPRTGNVKMIGVLIHNCFGKEEKQHRRTARVHGTGEDMAGRTNRSRRRQQNKGDSRYRPKNLQPRLFLMKPRPFKGQFSIKKTC